METSDDLSEAMTVLQGRLAELKDFFELDQDVDTMVYERWSAKDVLGHLVFWHESFARNLRDVSEGRTPHPLKGKLSEVNQQSVSSTRDVPIAALLNRLQQAQEVIEEHIANPDVSLIPYKKGSRDYPPLEHVEVVAAHIKRHLKDLRKALK